MARGRLLRQLATTNPKWNRSTANRGLRKSSTVVAPQTSVQRGLAHWPSHGSPSSCSSRSVGQP
eukprot:11201345-Lingulodinium_polyedra.AAC.1